MGKRRDVCLSTQSKTIGMLLRISNNCEEIRLVQCMEKEKYKTAEECDMKTNGDYFSPINK